MVKEFGATKKSDKKYFVAFFCRFLNGKYFSRKKNKKRKIIWKK
jgi:hypothetical protein